LCAAILAATHRPYTWLQATPVGGGSINQCYRLEGADGRRYFLKLNQAQHYPMLCAEAAGLAAIATTRTVRVPQCIAHGIAQGRSFLLLEYLALASRGDSARLGEQLAALHRCGSPQFGWSANGFIGTSVQPNAQSTSWIDFWREQRLGFQLRLAQQNGYGDMLLSAGERLMESLPAFFPGYAPPPSLLHGDLWGGNHGYLDDSSPVIFDPATYYGDRECDLAMTELFGGYPAAFYAAYRAAWPLDAGYATRRDLYNLYHLLNHANLFGGGYAGQAARAMRRLLAELGTH
jgi:fructosamine-3-kinase